MPVEVRCEVTPDVAALRHLEAADISWNRFQAMPEEERQKIYDRLQLQMKDRFELEEAVARGEGPSVQLPYDEHSGSIHAELLGPLPEPTPLLTAFPGEGSPAACGYVGIVNQGMTCYINSLLQVLFHLPLFRVLIYEIDALGDPIVLSLRSIFAQLECRAEGVQTTLLTNAFGWDVHDASTQHDVHELAQKLFDILETVVKGTPHEDFIRRLFYGELIYTSQSIESDDSSMRTEGFYDIELVVKEKSGIYESLDQLVAPERIEGVRLERLDGTSSVHTVDRSAQLTKLPPVLLIHPSRAAFCMETFERITLMNRWEFTEHLDLSCYTRNGISASVSAEETESGRCLMEELSAAAPSTEYTIHSIVIHSGWATMGHYFAYVRINEKWMCFNDTLVHEVTPTEVATVAFGGERENTWGAPLASNQRASLLVYVNKACEHMVMRSRAAPPAVIADVPRQMETQRREKEVLRNVAIEFTVCDESLPHELEFHDREWTPPRQVELPEQTPIADVHRAIAAEIGVDVAALRVWHYRSLPLAFPAEAVPHTSMQQHLHNVVEYLSPQQLAYLSDKADEADPFFAVIRVWASAGGCVLQYQGTVVCREELVEKYLSKEVPPPLLPPAPTPNAVEPATADNADEPPHKWCVAAVHGFNREPHIVEDLRDIPAGSNLIVYPSWVAQEDLATALAQRSPISVELRLLSIADTMSWVPLSLESIEPSMTYSQLQQVAYQAMLSPGNAAAVSLMAPRGIGALLVESIGFRTHEKTTNGPVSFVCPQWLSPIDPLGGVEEYTASSLINCYRHQKAKEVLYVEILPASLRSLDLSAIVIFDGGCGVHRNVFITTNILTLGTLFSIAMEQFAGCMPQELMDSITTRRNQGHRALRLLEVQSGWRLGREYLDEEEEVHVSSSTRFYLIDVLDDPPKGNGRYLNVFSCDRSSGERYFGYPTNIVSICPKEETSDILLERIARKMRVSLQEEEAKGKRAWRLAVRTKGGATFSFGRGDTLQKILDAAKDDADYLMVDRPEVIVTDEPTQRQRQRQREVGIFFRGPSSTALDEAASPTAATTHDENEEVGGTLREEVAHHTDG